MERYWALWAFSVVMRVLGVLSFLLMIYQLIRTAFTPVVIPVTGMSNEAVAALGWTIQMSTLVFFVGWFVASLGMYALGQFVLLMINLELNTRITADALQRRRERKPAPPTSRDLWREG